MNTLLRRSLLILGPAPLAALTLGVIAIAIPMGKSGIPPDDLLNTVAAITLVGSAFTLLPAIVTTIAVERAFAAGLNPRSGRCLGLLSRLGLASGTLIGLVLASMASLLIILPIMMTLGAWVGFLLGLLVRIPCFTPRE